MPHHSTVARTLQQRYRLRWHGLLIGSFTLLLMWCSAHVQMLLMCALAPRVPVAVDGIA